MPIYFEVTKQLKKLCLLLLLLIPFSSVSTEDEHNNVIHINAIDWCPQICMDNDKPGYIVDLVKNIFSNTEYQVKIQIFPWSRAIKNVREGNADALLSPAKSEAPDLVYPSLEVGFQQMCFFTLASSTWEYNGTNSLKGLQVGIAKDTSIEELNNYVANNPEQFQFQPYHERYLAQNLAKLKKKRMDTFLFTKNTTQYVMASLGEADNFRNAGCVSKAPIYMAFTPVNQKKVHISKIISRFEQSLKVIYDSRQYDQILLKYDLSAD